jgi:hypothetical protein
LDLRVTQDELNDHALAAVAGTDLVRVDGGWEWSCWVFASGHKDAERLVRLAGPGGTLQRVVGAC